MKKTALTIGLFSLVMVATSFASPEVSESKNMNLAANGIMLNENIKIDPKKDNSSTGTSGSVVGGNKKVDQLIGSVVGDNKKVD